MILDSRELRVIVVIPCYKVSQSILKVLAGIPDYVDHIVVVDDACPEKSGELVLSQSDLGRTSVIFHDSNLGVGGAMITGYRAALSMQADIVVKMDGDDQMDPTKILSLVHPIVANLADYTKGNRFYNITNIKRMPKIRFFGNIVLSFLTKLSSGYWKVFDPNNGFTAISKESLSQIPLNSVSNSYFFESDMLFQLGIQRAVVIDVPMNEIYGNEKSNLKIGKILLEFPYRHLKNFYRRIGYNYFLRDFSIATVELILGMLFFLFGMIYGLFNYFNSLQRHSPTSVSALLLVSLSILSGIQLLLGFVNYDLNSSPEKTIPKS